VQKSAKTDQAKNPQDIGSSLAAKKAIFSFHFILFVSFYTLAASIFLSQSESFLYMYVPV
jgi:hypothetical protein